MDKDIVWWNRVVEHKQFQHVLFQSVKQEPLLDFPFLQSF